MNRSTFIATITPHITVDASPAYTRQRELAVLDWLLYVVRGGAKPIWASRATVFRRKQVLIDAGIAPVTTGEQLAAIAEAFSVAPTNKGALLRLAWALRGSTGRLSERNADRYFADMVDEAANILAGLDVAEPNPIATVVTESAA
jgi:hypothetical protein